MSLCLTFKLYYKKYFLLFLKNEKQRESLMGKIRFKMTRMLERKEIIIQEGNNTFIRTKLIPAKYVDRHCYVECNYWFDLGVLYLGWTFIDTKKKEDEILKTSDDSFMLQRVDLSSCDVSDTFLIKLFERKTIQHITCDWNSHVVRFIKYKKNIKFISGLDFNCLEYVLDNFPNIKRIDIETFCSPNGERKEVILNKIVSKGIIPEINTNMSNRSCPHRYQCECWYKFMSIITNKTKLYLLRDLKCCELFLLSH